MFIVGAGRTGLVRNVSMRTCLGCGNKKAKNNLLRFTVNKENFLFVDTKGQLGGRGAYCCNKNNCFKSFLRKRKKIAKALRVQEIQINAELMGFFRSE